LSTRVAFTPCFARPAPPPFKSLPAQVSALSFGNLLHYSPLLIGFKWQEMVDFLVDVWKQGGLCDWINRERF